MQNGEDLLLHIVGANLTTTQWSNQNDCTEQNA